MDSPSRTSFPLQRIKVAVFLFAVVIAIGAITFVFSHSFFKGSVNTAVKSQEATVAVTPSAEVVTPEASEKNKTDFGTKVPEDFPTDIPLEEGAGINQSYGLDYTGQKQLTMVFASKKTMKNNYALYADFLKKQQWTVSNQYESETLSALYGTKEGLAMNVTISVSTPTSSQVSISVLKQ